LCGTRTVEPSILRFWAILRPAIGSGGRECSTGEDVMPEPEASDLFTGLVLSLQMSAYSQLGKIMSPMTGKVERDLAGARAPSDPASTGPPAEESTSAE